MDILNTNKERMNKKIENTNDTIHSTMNKVNKWIK